MRSATDSAVGSIATGVCMGGAGQSIHLGNSDLGSVRHVCAFFADDAEAYRILIPFIVEGLQRGEKAVHVLQLGREGEHRERLGAAGLDLAAITASGQLELRSNTDTYLRDGTFDQHQMFAAFERMASGNAGTGFPRSRIVCNMEWLERAPSARNDIMEFEARVNTLWERHEDIVICVYDLRRISGDVMMDVMRTHPVVLAGDVLYENPFFVPPDRFLRERRAREAS